MSASQSGDRKVENADQKDLNKLHVNILEGFLRFYFDYLKECPPDIALIGFEAIFNDAEYEKFLSQLIQHDIKDVVDPIRAILKHPYPQNRADSYPYVAQEAGFVMYAIREGDVKSRDDHAIHLVNGTVIPKAMVIRNYVSKDLNALSVVAKEPEGMLSLTAQGPITKPQLIHYLEKRCEEEKKQIQEANAKLLEQVSRVYTMLLYGLTVMESKADDMSLAMNDFKLADAKLKRAVILKIVHAFPEEKEFAIKSEEKETDYLERMTNSLLERITTNSKEVEREVKVTSTVPERLKTLRRNAIAYGEARDQAKEKAIKQFWRESKLTSADSYAQWNSLVAREENYDDLNFAKNRFKPDKRVLEEIKKYKQLDATCATLENWARENSEEIAIIEFQRSQRKEKEILRQQSQLWLSYLRHGKFEEADQCFAKNPKINIRAVDEFGKNALYYALVHHHYLFAYKIVKLGVETVSPANAVLSMRDDVKQALESQSPLSRTERWAKVIENEIVYDLNKLICGISKNTLDELRKKYASYGWGSVYSGDQWNSKIDEILKQFIAYQKEQFWFFSRGFIVGDLESFQRIFMIIDQRNLLHELSEEALKFATYDLEKYCKDKQGDLEVIRIKFERLNKLAIFESMLTRLTTMAEQGADEKKSAAPAIKGDAILSSPGSSPHALHAKPASKTVISAADELQAVVAALEAWSTNNIRIMKLPADAKAMDLCKQVSFFSKKALSTIKNDHKDDLISKATVDWVLVMLDQFIAGCNQVGNDAKNVENIFKQLTSFKQTLQVIKPLLPEPKARAPKQNRSR